MQAQIDYEKTMEAVERSGARVETVMPTMKNLDKGLIQKLSDSPFVKNMMRTVAGVSVMSMAGGALAAAKEGLDEHGHPAPVQNSNAPTIIQSCDYTLSKEIDLSKLDAERFKDFASVLKPSETMNSPLLIISSDAHLTAINYDVNNNSVKYQLDSEELGALIGEGLLEDVTSLSAEVKFMEMNYKHVLDDVYSRVHFGQESLSEVSYAEDVMLVKDRETAEKYNWNTVQVKDIDSEVAVEDIFFENEESLYIMNMGHDASKNPFDIMPKVDRAETILEDCFTGSHELMHFMEREYNLLETVSYYDEVFDGGETTYVMNEHMAHVMQTLNNQAEGDGSLDAVANMYADAFENPREGRNHIELLEYIGAKNGESLNFEYDYNDRDASINSIKDVLKSEAAFGKYLSDYRTLQMEEIGDSGMLLMQAQQNYLQTGDIEVFKEVANQWELYRAQYFDTASLGHGTNSVYEPTLVEIENRIADGSLATMSLEDIARTAKSISDDHGLSRADVWTAIHYSPNGPEFVPDRFDNDLTHDYVNDIAHITESGKDTMTRIADMQKTAYDKYSPTHKADLEHAKKYANPEMKAELVEHFNHVLTSSEHEKDTLEVRALNALADTNDKERLDEVDIYSEVLPYEERKNMIGEVLQTINPEKYTQEVLQDMGLDIADHEHEHDKTHEHSL